MQIEIDRTKPVVILTGAGISKESGLETFRDPDGIWSKVRIEDVATPDAFRRNPERVHEFYNMRRAALIDADVLPNAAHKALVQLEDEWPGGVLVVTQNVDDLHERAGSRNLIHMHGEILKARCAHCDTLIECRHELAVTDACGTCGRTGGLRPNVVWFGEMPMFMDEIEAALRDCALFMSIGTSGNVYPAAGFVQAVRHYGTGHTVELNMEPSEGASAFVEKIYGPAGTIVPDYVNRLLGP